MTAIAELQAAHEALLRRHQAGEDILDPVLAYIEQARARSIEVSAPRERDQIRANLRFWASYVYEKKKLYPSVDLPPGVPPVRLPGTATLSIPAIFGLVGLACVVLAALAAVFGRDYLYGSSGPTATATPSPDRTRTPDATNTALVTVSDVPTSGETDTPTPTLAPPDTPTPTTPPQAIAVQIANPQEGQAVGPVTTLSGAFDNLQPGWSIHVLLQPLSAGGRYFPLRDFFRVPGNASSGEWSLVATLAQGAGLEQPEQYNVRLVVALDDAGRQLLTSAADRGLDEIPQGLLPFPQVVTFSRSAYHAIREERVLYAAMTDKNTDLFVARLDGSDIRQVTRTPQISEWGASLSPAGEQIVLIRQERDSSGNPILSLALMDSDGQNVITLAKDPGASYDRPLWSPDGRYIAFSANIPEITGRSFSLFVYDMETGERRQLKTDFIGPRFPSWLPDNQTLVFSAFPPFGGTQDLLRIDLATEKVARLLDTRSLEETHAAVSPDGARVAYVGYPTGEDQGNRDIYVLDLGSGESQRLTTGSALDWFPAWSMDGKAIYFESWRTGAYIWAMDPDGRNPRQIIHDTPTSAGPNVGPMSAFLPITP